MKKHRFVSSLSGLWNRKVRDTTYREIWQDWKWIFSFTAGRTGAVVLYTLFGIAGSALALLTSVLSKGMIDAIVAMDTGRLLPLAGLMLAGGLFTLLFQSLTTRFSTRLGLDMQNDVREQVFHALMDSDWLTLSGYSTGDLLNRFSSDISTVSNCAVSWLPKLVIQSFTVLSTLAVIVYYDPVMALIGCASMPVLFLTSHHFLRAQREHNRRMRQVSSKMSAFQSETFRNLDTLKSFGVEEQVCQQLHRHQDTLRQSALDYNLFSIRTNIWLTCVSTAVQYAALGYCLWRLWRGEILFGTMVLFLQQRSSLTTAFHNLISLVPTALSGSVSAERVRELMELKKESKLLAAEPGSACRLVLEHVTAGYKPDAPVLRDISLEAAPGQVIALVGPSGQGKTTLLRLILGLLAPAEGQIFLQEADGTRHPIGAQSRHWFSYVPQGNTLLAGTIAENLRLGNGDATEPELCQALQAACAWEFVRQLPQGLDTPIGEGGKGLSEGQAQRIAIARALLRKAPVLLLDEVTSALDTQTEEAVFSNLTALGITTLVTTHRPSVLKLCSQVYRLENQTLEPICSDSTD